MILSYVDILGDSKRHRINATITTDHTQSSYGQPVIVMPDGGLLDLTSWALMGYQVVKANQQEIEMLRKYIGTLALTDSNAAAALGRIGGQSTSAAKQQAARENGKRGGRPRKQTQ